MKYTYLILLLANCLLLTGCKDNSNSSKINFGLEFERVDSSALPPLHSFAYVPVKLAKQNYLFVVGGNVAGVHQFDNSVGYNHSIYLLDLQHNKIIASMPLNILHDKTIQNHLATVSSEFLYNNGYLYYIGGLNASNLTGPDLVTYPQITRIDVAKLSQAMFENRLNNPDQYFKTYATESKLRLTGGLVAKIKDDYYLAFGQNFNMIYIPQIDGKYSPYIYKIKIDNDAPKPLTIVAEESSISLGHRRDNNIWTLSSKDNHSQLLISGGPFKPITKEGQALLYENTVILNTESQLNMTSPKLVQQFNQYLAPTISMYSETHSENYLLTIGGISAHTLNPDNSINELLSPPNFSNVISLLVGRENQWNEYYSSEQFLPLGYFCHQCDISHLYSGTSAVFIIDDNIPTYTDNGQIDYDKLVKLHPNQSKILLGTMYGGLVSYSKVVDLGTPVPSSSASNNVYKIYLSLNKNSWINSSTDKDSNK